MAEITTTRADVRRAIGRQSRQEFWLRYSSPVNITAGSTTTPSVTASDLTQDTDYWQGDWVYLIAASDERMIINSSSNGLLTLDYPQAEADTSGDSLEIWGLWPPSHVHDAINRSIRHAWRFFPNVVEANQWVHHADAIRYGLDSASLNADVGDVGTNALPNVADVYSIWLETSRQSYTGYITSTNSATVFNDTLNLWTTDSDGNVVDSNWLISIYDGPGRGQLRQLNTWDTDGAFTVDTGWTTAPDANTSYYRAWNPSTNIHDQWYKITAARFDQPEGPEWFELVQHYPAAYGLRLKVIYGAQPITLDDETTTTIVPLEYLTYKSLAILYAGLVGDNKYDRPAHAGLSEYYEELAAQFAQTEGRHLPAQTLWAERDYGSYSGQSDDINPLDWPE